MYDECFLKTSLLQQNRVLWIWNLVLPSHLTTWDEIFYLHLLLELKNDVCMMATYDVICYKLTNFLCVLFEFHCSPDIWLVRVLDAAEACWLLPPIERVAPRTWSIGMECISSSANWRARCNWISIQQGVSCKYHDVELIIGWLYTDKKNKALWIWYTKALNPYEP